MDVIDRTGATDDASRALRHEMVARRAAHREYIVQEGEDLPEIREWCFQGGAAPRSAAREAVT
jgi:xylulose-5-phosphate/fructose-6-phosphate phosphoketolase